MNKQTTFYVKLMAKRNAFKELIKDAVRHANDPKHPATKDFFLEEEIKYKAKLDLVEEIIEEYLRD